MRAMILAAGRGERLRPITDTIPKPMVKVGEHELIVWHILKLKSAGIVDIVVNSAHLSKKLVSFLGDGSSFGVNITHSVEGPGGLETAGGIIKALAHFKNEPFFVINGDIFLDIEYKKLISDIHLNDNLAYLYLCKNPSHNLKGDFSLDNGHVVYGHDYTFTGAGIYSPQAFLGFKEERLKLRSFFDRWILQNKVLGAVLDAPWFDVGTISRLNTLNEYLKDR